jgi:hypothetical protein
MALRKFTERFAASDLGVGAAGGFALDGGLDVGMDPLVPLVQDGDVSIKRGSHRS